MKIFDFDPRKDIENIEKHGLSLQLASQFDWEHAFFRPDHRKDYGELRMIGLGYIGQRLCVMVFVVRAGTYRIISLRKANTRERRGYEQKANAH